MFLCTKVWGGGGWKVHLLSSFLLLMWWLIWPMKSKHCNTDGRSMLKNKPHLITFHENILVSLWTMKKVTNQYFFLSGIFGLAPDFTRKMVTSCLTKFHCHLTDMKKLQKKYLYINTLSRSDRYHADFP